MRLMKYGVMSTRNLSSADSPSRSSSVSSRISRDLLEVVDTVRQLPAPVVPLLVGYVLPLRGAAAHGGQAVGAQATRGIAVVDERGRLGGRQCAARGLGPCLRLHRVDPPLEWPPAPVVRSLGCIEPIQCEWTPIIAKARRTVHGAIRVNRRTMARATHRRGAAAAAAAAVRLRCGTEVCGRRTVRRALHAGVRLGAPLHGRRARGIRCAHSRKSCSPERAFSARAAGRGADQGSRSPARGQAPGRSIGGRITPRSRSRSGPSG